MRTPGEIRPPQKKENPASVNSDSQPRILSRKDTRDPRTLDGRSRPPTRHSPASTRCTGTRFALSCARPWGLSRRLCQKNCPVRNHVLFLLSHLIHVGRSKASMPFHMFFLVTAGRAGVSTTPTLETSKNGTPLSKIDSKRNTVWVYVSSE